MNHKFLFFGVAGLMAGVLSQHAAAQGLIPGDLLISGSTYDAPASAITVGQALPGGGTAVSNAAYPTVFNNETPDPSFGITTPIFIQQLNLSTNGVDNTINVPTSTAVTSFSSKSELALNVTPSGVVTFSGYNAPDTTLDVSNSNTPGLFDNTNPVSSTYARSVLTLQPSGSISVVQDSAYSGNNQRAVILDPATGNYITVGNAGNGSASGAGLDALSANTGVQIFNPSSSTTTGGAYNTTVVGVYQNSSMGNANGDQYGFSITQAGFAADKTGKDDNFRGETIGPDGSLYVTKGSGSNGINTVYKVSAPGGGLPTLADASTTTITILPGFNATSAKTGKNSNGTTGTVYHPFGLWFANATTLYVADEGNGALSDATNEAANTGGLQKWTFNTLTSKWVLDYTLTNQLLTGVSYSPAGYPTGSNTGSGGTNQPWAVYADGLRNITGTVNGDGTVTIYGVTSTVSGDTDVGADPNQIVAITDTLADTTPIQVTGESFGVVEAAQNETVYRGVAIVPEPGSMALLVAGAAFLGGFRRRKG